MKALRAGAFDYLRKPLRIAEFVESIQRGLAARGQEETSANMNSAAGSGTITWESCLALAGKSPHIAEVKHALLQLQKSGRRPPILIEGEAGVGKLQLAETLHLVCCGHDKPFVVYNCAEKSTLEIEEDIYGNGIGGGILQSALGGTLVLEYVEKIDQELQTQLTQVFAKQTAQGWLICLAGVHLEEEMVAGSVSTEFAYYLMDTVLHLPTLQERMEDLEDLVAHILKNSLAIAPQARQTQFSPDVYDLIRKSDWPNNILGLEQYIIYCVSKGRTANNTVPLEVARRYLRQMQGQG
ncbi:MAG: sigma 54-interacting transcriptional regulator [Verrucomicrobia bacterium]|nr:sigma 54-interacting transcriptional regulator [Verrucomicrobiota bacterium]